MVLTTSFSGQERQLSIHGEADEGQISQAKHKAKSYSFPINSLLSQGPCSNELGYVFDCIVPLNRELDIYFLSFTLIHADWNSLYVVCVSDSSKVNPGGLIEQSARIKFLEAVS